MNIALGRRLSLRFREARIVFLDTNSSACMHIFQTVFKSSNASLANLFIHLLVFARRKFLRLRVLLAFASRTGKFKFWQLWTPSSSCSFAQRFIQLAHRGKRWWCGRFYRFSRCRWSTQPWFRSTTVRWWNKCSRRHLNHRSFLPSLRCNRRSTSSTCFRTGSRQSSARRKRRWLFHSVGKPGYFVTRSLLIVRQ